MPEQLVSIKIDTFHLTYILFPESFALPAVHFDGLTYENASRFLEPLQKYVPHYIKDCQVLPEPRPRKDSQQLHLVREYQIAEQKYLYIFRIHAAYMGGAQKAEFIEQATKGKSACVNTDRIYFQARLVPVHSIKKLHGQIVDFEALQIKDSLFKVSSNETRRDMWSTVLFDEVDFRELNQNFTQIFSFESEWQMGKLFQPFVVDYLTLCLNLINPDWKILHAVLPHYHEGFQQFLQSHTYANPSEAAELFWSAYYAIWSRKLTPARSGNPHWEITTYADRNWLAQIQN